MIFALQNNSKNFLGLFVKSIVFFPLIYSISFIESFVSLTTEKIALIILLAYAFFFSNKRMMATEAKHDVVQMYFVQFFLLVYTSLILLLIGFGSGTNILPYIIYFLVMVPLELYALINLFDNVDELMKVLFIISLFQVLIIVGTLINPSFARFIDSTFNSVGSYYDYQIMRMIHYPGGISCITSTGALKLSLGVVSGMYLYQKSKGNILYFILTFFIVVISTIVARTGIFIGGTAIALLILTMILRNESVSVFFKRAIVVAVIGCIVYFFIADNAESMFVRLMWLEEKGLDKAFFNSYFQGKTTVIPELSWKTIVGTGIFSGESGNGVFINADGNFVRMYCAIGLPLAIGFYLFLFYKMFKSAYLVRSNSLVLYTTILMTFVMIIGEFKEPFFYTRYLFVLFYLIVYLFEKNYVNRLIPSNNIMTIYKDSSLERMTKRNGAIDENIKI